MKFYFSNLCAALALANVASATDLFQGDGTDGGNQSIVGGTVATVGRYSYTVALSANGQFCGGSLIAPDTVLTAAHCMDGSSFDVIINRHDLSKTSDGESIPRKTELVHPGYNGNTMDNDYALVFLSRATTQKVDFIKLNQDEAYPAAGSTSRTMGWGTTSSGGSSSNVLREVNLPIISNQLCDQKYPNDSIFATNICTFEPGKDSCQGDSGGPLITPGDTAAGDKLIGIVSWGIGCATSQYPGVYARVSNQIEWIKTNVCKNSAYPPSDLCGASGTGSPTKKPTPKPTPNPVVGVTDSPTKKPSPKPTPSPVISSTKAPTSGCFPAAQKVKLESTTGQQIHVFDLKVLSEGNDVAAGKSASQSSTLNNKWKFAASKAVDGNYGTFSHTSDNKAWLEIDLGGLYPIDTVEIANRYCGSNPSDPMKCLCRLSNAKLSLIDDKGVVVATKSIGDACGEMNISLEFDSSCAPPQGCDSSANKVLVESSTGKQIHIFELEVYSSEVNVARGKSATQSSTFNNQWKFAASRAIDGKYGTYSHTNDANPWLQVDLQDTYSVDFIAIANRYCGKNPSDPKKCLCHLSNARVSLLDASGTVVHSKTIGDTCGMHDVYIDFFDDGCSNNSTYMPTSFPTGFPTWW